MPELRLPAGPIHAKALVFDKDGVLVDFHRYWGAIARARADLLVEETGARQALLAQLGFARDRVDPDGPLATATRAESMAVAAGFLYGRGVPWVEARDRAQRAFQDAESRVPLDALTECPGARATLAELKGQGWRIGVATTDSRAHARASLEQLEMVDLVDALACGDEVARPKPHREMLDRVCAQLGVPCHQVAVVGDGVNDLKMARAGGAAAAIGVLGGVSREADLAGHADVVLADVSHLRAITMAQ